MLALRKFAKLILFLKAGTSHTQVNKGQAHLNYTFLGQTDFEVFPLALGSNNILSEAVVNRACSQNLSYSTRL